MLPTCDRPSYQARLLARQGVYNSGRRRNIFIVFGADKACCLLAYLRAYVARGAALADISTLLADAAAHFAATGARLRQPQLLALTAWQQLQLGDAEAAAASLARARLLAQETGYTRVLLDIPALAHAFEAR